MATNKELEKAQVIVNGKWIKAFKSRCSFCHTNEYYCAETLEQVEPETKIGNVEFTEPIYQLGWDTTQPFPYGELHDQQRT